MVPLFAALLSLVVSTPGSMAARQGGAEPLWQVPIERRVEHVFLTDDGTLLGVGEEGLLAFDPDSGAVRWLFPRGEANGIEVFETGEGGVIAIVTRLGQSAIAPAGPAYAIMLIETATGRAHWRTAPAPGAVVGRQSTSFTVSLA